jgi:phospholipid transport system substrate-binding protein
MKSILCAVFTLLVLAQADVDSDERSAEAFLRGKVDTVTSVLHNPDVDQQKKHDEITRIVSEMFDFPLMAKLSLGGENWRALPESKREQFTALFVKRLQKTYSAKLKSYRDEKFLYEPAQKEGKKVQIPTYLVSSNQKMSILYKIYRSEHDWKIYDLEIEGISVVRSYRAQFLDILQRGTIDDVLIALEKSIDD